jgi:histidinol-phosphatase (PHP family)
MREEQEKGLPCYFDSHMHTPLCMHAAGEPEDYARVGEGRGLQGVIITCHSPMPDGFFDFVRMRPDQLGAYVEMVARAVDAMRGRIEVKLGLESDYFPGMEGWLEDLHGRAAFEYILGSVHYQGPEYQDRFGDDDPVAFQRTYFGLLADSAETGLFDCLAHPDLVKNEAPADWDFERLREDVAVCLDRIAATGVAMELNTSGLLKSLPEMNPNPAMLAMMREREIPVVIGSDSHMPRRVGADFETALDLLEAAGYTHASWFARRRRADVPIGQIRASLESARMATPQDSVPQR